MTKEIKLLTLIFISLMLIGIHDRFYGKFDAEIVSSHNRDLQGGTELAVTIVCGAAIATFFGSLAASERGRQESAAQGDALRNQYWVTQFNIDHSNYDYYYAWWMGYYKGKRIPKDQCTIPYTNFIAEERFKAEIRREPKYTYQENLIDRYSQYQRGFYRGFTVNCCN